MRRFVVPVDAEDAAGIVEAVGTMRALEIARLRDRQAIDRTVAGRKAVQITRVAHRGSAMGMGRDGA
jgi:hypothetical protein